MKDSAKLLNFRTNRELKFTAFRSVDFSTGRVLSFNLNRDLSFDSQRDLGFGKRGVVFRGYVCPVCRAPVARDAAKCDECGVKFEQPAKKAQSRKKKAFVDPGASRIAAQERMDDAPKAPAPQRRSTFECPGCGKILYVGAEQCPGCMTLFTSAPPPARPPAMQQAPKMMTCTNCGFGIPPQDKFCRRCGTKRPESEDGTTVTWDEYMAKGRDDGIVSWDEYSRRGG